MIALHQVLVRYSCCDHEVCDAVSKKKIPLRHSTSDPLIAYQGASMDLFSVVHCKGQQDYLRQLWNVKPELISNFPGTSNSNPHNNFPA